MENMTPTFLAWRGMVRSCLNPAHPTYQSVGGAGIDIDKRWKKHFDFFVEDMGPCPPGATLQRFDNDRDFTPGNCYWEGGQ
jgi:hypothetical protein